MQSLQACLSIPSMLKANEEKIKRVNFNLSIVDKNSHCYGDLTVGYNRSLVKNALKFRVQQRIVVKRMCAPLYDFQRGAFIWEEISPAPSRASLRINPLSPGKISHKN